jgi:hypothetical protein
VIVLASIVAAAAVAAAAMIVLEFPEGMPWSFRARDGDPGLTRAARRALPLAAAVDRFRATSGACPSSRIPADVAAILALLPADQRATAGGAEFSVSPTSPAICRVAVRLTHDEILYRESDGTTVRWVYDPGDGTDTRPVTLAP